jgi:hypothetical protein
MEKIIGHIYYFLEKTTNQTMNQTINDSYHILELQQLYLSDSNRNLVTIIGFANAQANKKNQ